MELDIDRPHFPFGRWGREHGLGLLAVRKADRIVEVPAAISPSTIFWRCSVFLTCDEIELRAKVVAALKAQRAASLLKSEYVFPNANGGCLDRDNVSNRSWLPALRKAGLRRRTMYQTRHSFATLALEAGESIGWVANQLGHQDISMVVKVYYRWIKNPARQDGSLFDKRAAEAGL